MAYENLRDRYPAQRNTGTGSRGGITEAVVKLGINNTARRGDPVERPGMRLLVSEIAMEDLGFTLQDRVEIFIDYDARRMLVCVIDENTVLNGAYGPTFAVSRANTKSKYGHGVIAPTFPTEDAPPCFSSMEVSYKPVRAKKGYKVAFEIDLPDEWYQ